MTASAEAAERRVRLAAHDFAVEAVVDTRHLETQYGPRFDRSAVIVSVRRGGVEFVEARGLGDEFGLRGLGVLGYEEVAVGAGEFLKIGIGALRRDWAGDYSFARHWPVVESAVTRIADSRDGLAVEQSSPWRHGYAYLLCKNYRITAEGVLTMDYQLWNRGERPFPFEHYNHNFFSFTGEPSDGCYAVRPAFALAGPGNDHWRIVDGALRLAARAPDPGGVVFGTEVTAPASENRVTLAHADGPAVELAGDFPVARFAVWASGRVICPEVFFRSEIAPGKSVSWRRVYRFYSR